MNKPYDFITFIGRFQPVHIGHVEVLKKALELSDNVIVLIGSSFQPRTPKNPFNYNEREYMIRTEFNKLNVDGKAKLFTYALRDFPSNNAMWCSNVQRCVDEALLHTGWTDYAKRGAIIGHDKDKTSFYLHMFPQWELIDHTINEVVNATDIRTLYFESNLRYLRDVVSAEIYSSMETFKSTQKYKDLYDWHIFIVQYIKDHDVGPYTVQYNTVDAVIVQSGHVLMVQRKHIPGKGLMALPGGFLHADERIIDGMIRELREETKLKVPDPVLKGSVVRQAVFDDPNRSLRGRTITHAFFIELAPGPLPKVKGADDALKAVWVPLSEVKSEDCFEDHYHIIESFLGSLT